MPSFWSQLATNVICSKYFYGEVGTPEREYSVKQLVHRVARTIADWGIEDGYFASPARWRAVLPRAGLALPASARRVQFAGLVQRRPVPPIRRHRREVQLALGRRSTQDVVQPENPYEFPQGSACFIQRVEDNMEDIMELARSEAMLFKFGSGTGTDLSTLRSHREKLAGGGKPSGPLSFMRVYDQIAAVVKSGGKTRRAAKMQSIKVWHPDVMEFIECKWKEEQKARVPDREGRLRGQLQRRSLQLDHVPERQPLGPRDRRLHAGRRAERRLDDPLGHQPRAARPDLPGPRGREPDGRVRLALRRSRRAVRHDDQPLAHLPQQRPHQRVRIRAASTCSSTTRPATWRAST